MDKQIATEAMNEMWYKFMKAACCLRCCCYGVRIVILGSILKGVCNDAVVLLFFCCQFMPRASVLRIEDGVSSGT